jgi:diadenosine tetraphosphate (Ap4A) HIT family hydrolase
MCAGLGADETPGGLRFYEGRWGDAYLSRRPVRPGHAVVIWKAGHVTEPTDLAAEAAAGFWADVAVVARAIEARYRPEKMNWMSLGNWVPHLHVHVVPRAEDDPAAGQPMEAEAFSRGHDLEVPDAVLAEEVEALRRMTAP